MNESAFNSFCEGWIDYKKSRSDQALGFLYFHVATEDESGAPIAILSEYFSKANLPKQNPTRLLQQLKSRKEVLFDNRSKKLRLARSALQSFDKEASHLVRGQPSPELVSDAKEVPHESPDLSSTPLIDNEDLDDLNLMRELYSVLYCLENSVRRVIEKVLRKKLGADWWEHASNASMKKKHEQRKKNEEENKWLPVRANLGPLYSLDWSDLVTLMRQHEAEFLPLIGSIKFVHRIEDLGQLRHVVAHNGVLRDKRNVERIKVYFGDWVEQIGKKL